MGDRRKPPFRADHVGSLLRPKSITNGFKKFRNAEIQRFRNAEIETLRNLEIEKVRK